MSQSWKIREVKDIPRGRPVMSHHLAWPFMNAMLFIRRGQNRQNHMQQLSQEVDQNEVASSVKGFSGCHPSQRSLVILLPEYGMPMMYTKENPTALVGSNTFREWTIYTKHHRIQE